MPVFQLAFTGISLLFSAYLYFRGIRPLTPWTGSGGTMALSAVLTAGLINILWLPWVHWQATRSPGKLDLFLEAGAYRWIGLFSLILFCLLSRELVLLGARLIGPSSLDLHAASAAGALIGGILLYAIGSWIAHQGPRVRKVSLESTSYSGDRPLKIVQISDLHISTSIRRPYVENVVHQVNALEPDLVVFTGDIADGDPQSHDPDLEPLLRLQPRVGSYYSTGNHEFYWDENAWMSKFSELGLQVLDNRSESLRIHGGSVTIAGINDTRPDFEKALEDATPESFTVLLAHRPGHAKAAKNYPVNLQLSGHTHGGQFLPWSLIIGLFHEHAKGLAALGSLNLYVNVGTGFWGPPIRLGTVSEITEISVTPAARG